MRFRGFRKLGAALRLAIGKQGEKSEGDISQFQALSAAMAATVGTGSIVGVSTAIAIGGPGALWTFSDVANELMALPNLIGILVLSGLVARETKYYLENDLKLRAPKSQVEIFMDGRPGWADWKAGDVIGSSRTFTGRSLSKRLQAQQQTRGNGDSGGITTATE